MNIVKKFGILVSAVCLFAGANLAQAATTAPATAANSQIKVAVVNVQQVLQQSPRVTALSKKLENQFKARQAQIGTQQKSLQDELDKFNKEAPTMAAKDRDVAQKKITNDRASLMKEVVAYQQDLQREQTKIMQNILGDLNRIVSKIAKDQGDSLVLDSQAVIFAADGNDITKQVADAFNSQS